MKCDVYCKPQWENHNSGPWSSGAKSWHPQQKITHLLKISSWHENVPYDGTFDQDTSDHVPRNPLMSWALLDPPRHKVRGSQQQPTLRWKRQSCISWTGNEQAAELGSPESMSPFRVILVIPPRNPDNAYGPMWSARWAVHMTNWRRMKKPKLGVCLQAQSIWWLHYSLMQGWPWKTMIEEYFPSGWTWGHYILPPSTLCQSGLMLEHVQIHRQWWITYPVGQGPGNKKVARRPGVETCG